MSRVGVALLALTALALVGIGHASAGHPTPKTKIITVTKVVTHTEHNTVIKTEPLPDVCRTVLTMLDAQVTSFGTAEESSARLLRGIDAAKIALFEKDIPALTTATQTIIRESDTVGTTAVKGKQAVPLIQYLLNQCLKEANS